MINEILCEIKFMNDYTNVIKRIFHHHSKERKNDLT